jgi:hypothetical protein
MAFFFVEIREKNLAVRATNLSSYNAHPLALSIAQGCDTRERSLAMLF